MPCPRNSNQKLSSDSSCKARSTEQYFLIVFNKTIIPLTLVGYEMIMIIYPTRRYALHWLSIISYPTRVRGILIIVNFSLQGQVYVNGFNLGRYWPVAGPQETLFVPGSLLSSGSNEVLFLELDGAPCWVPEICFVQSVSTPILNGPVHVNPHTHM